MQASLPFLNNMLVGDFLRMHWQKQLLSVRDAFPGFTPLLSRQDLFDLAGREDVESRLVRHTRNGWQLEHGPFSASRLAKLPQRDWTLLVQGVNLHDDRADRLLRLFSFIPQARLDDLMISYAVPGGGVGPHFDSYDVFLLQALGERRWETSAQSDLTLLPDLPLKILANFQPTESAVYRPGDLLYLPPRFAHDGVALTECMTYSVGFRAPSWQELGCGFLQYLQDRWEYEGIYSDPNLQPTAAPAAIGADMRQRVSEVLKTLRWDDDDIGCFLGCYLSEPKPSVYFDPPTRPLGNTSFAKALASKAVALDRKTQMLYDGLHLYCNGEAYPFEELAAGSASWLRNLADRRLVSAPLQPDTALLELLYDWYSAGFLHLQRS